MCQNIHILTPQPFRFYQNPKLDLFDCCISGNRTKPNLDDLHLAFQDTGVVLQELENFVAQVDPLQFIHPFTTYPKCQPCRLQHPSKGEFVDRAEFYSEHLPPLPITFQEPAGSV